MLFSDAITKARAGTLHDVDTQFSDTTQLLPVLADEYRRQRRWLCTYCPTLCRTVVSGIAATQATPYILKSALANFEKIDLVEKLYGSTYFPVDVVSPIDRSVPTFLSVCEMPAQLNLFPTNLADGTFQVTYLAGAPATITAATLIDLPGGLEDVVVQRGCAWIRQRHNEDHSWHEKEAERIQLEAYSQLRQRYGSHGQPGLKRERRRWW